jgi:signal transduction histidine kinase
MEVRLTRRAVTEWQGGREMEYSASAGAGDPTGHVEPGRVGPAERVTAGPRELHGVLAASAACVLFVADLLVQRGATPAIGYAIVPVLAGGCRRRGVIVGLTVTCTVLTWLGFVLEPPGVAWWMSAFDRSMLCLVLWLALLLVLRRLALIDALAERTSALEAAADELSRSNAELDRFASVVAHDLRGPLNTIGLSAQLLAACRPGPADPDTDACVKGIRSEIDRMNAMIQRLLRYGHVGGGALRATACECDAVLAAVRRSLAVTLDGCGAAVTHDPLPVVRADPVLLAALFQNLIENAVKYRAADRPPVVHVSASREADRWVIAVRDNGIGIKPADRESIFRPFTQLRDAARDGVGLGLATCQRIVRRHGGRIWVESTPGQGSTFFFTLDPADVAPSAAAGRGAAGVDRV